MKNFKLMLLVLLVLVMMAMIVGCSGDSEIVPEESSSEPEETTETEETVDEEPEVEAIEITLGHQMTPESTEGRAYQYFADLVSERSGGSLEIILYPAEQLGDSKSQIESTLIGTQDIVATGASLFSRFDSIFSTLTIPFLFEDNSKFSELMQGEVGQKQAQSLKDNGLVLVNPARNMMRGPYRVLVSKEPIESVDDIEGLRFRTYENEIYMNAWKTLGANPIIIPWGETYMALMQDTVEAVVSPMSLLYSMKFTEEAKYVTAIYEYTSDCIWAMNQDKFNTLTEEQQEIIFQAAGEAGEYLTELDEASVQDNIKKMQDENGAVFTEIDTDPFREKLTDYYYELVEEGVLPEELVNDALGK
ncbi:MAG: hypothetical protein AVO33_00305 [delta proteobacterium ML8_F1]|nr:MAG: hypothetical protein AVO33_00305 [delta proteobacterium ML8_F1]